jgi:hypothetical protein
MRAQPLGAALSVSIDLPADAVQAGRSIDAERETVGRLLELIAAVDQPVTWFADDPAANPTIGRALATGSGHEAALRVDANWLGKVGGRNRLAAEIVGRIARARRVGISITTLALADAAAELPAELLVKHGITAIRDSLSYNRADHSRGGMIGPVPLRYGLWRLAVDFRLLGGSRIADWLTAIRIRRAIDRCIRGKMPLHLVIDAAAVAANSGPDRVGGLPGVLRHIERRRNAGLLRVMTIADVVAQLAAPSAPRSAGSILRAA